MHFSRCEPIARARDEPVGGGKSNRRQSTAERVTLVAVENKSTRDRNARNMNNSGRLLRSNVATKKKKNK